MEQETCFEDNVEVQPQISNNKKHERCDQQLSESTFSILFVAPPWSASMLFAVVCVCFQYSIIFLLLYDQIDREHAYNRFKLPVMVTTYVRIAQFFAVYLAVCTSDDLIDSLRFLFVGIDEDTIKNIPGASKTKWYISNLAKLLEGSASLMVILILIAQSDACFSLFLNFAALAFVWAIDDVFFSLAVNSFFADSITECASSISSITIPSPTKTSIIVQKISLHLVAVASYIFWAILFYNQLNGDYMCKSLLIQFGDEIDPVTSRFSGIFEIKPWKENKSGRFIFEHKLKNSEERAILAYCFKYSTWTLSITNSSTFNECDDNTIKAKSSITKTYDVTTEHLDWYVRRNEDKKRYRYTIYDFSKVECITCDRQVDPSKSFCSGYGKCNNEGKCDCEDGVFGPSCEYDYPCENIIATSRSAKFEYWCTDLEDPFAEAFTEIIYPSDFKLMKKENTREKGSFVTIRGRPVYYQELTNKESSCIKDWYDPRYYNTSDYGLIFFNGYRWVITHATDLIDFHKEVVPLSINFDDLKEYLHKHFDPVNSKYRPRMYSNSVEQSSPADMFPPDSTEWYYAFSSSGIAHEKNEKMKEKSLIFSTMGCK